MRTLGVGEEGERREVFMLVDMRLCCQSNTAR